jgi:hypothetical protein
VRWRNVVHPWVESHDPEEFVPKGRKSSRSTPNRPRRRRPSAWTSWDRRVRVPILPHQAGRRTATGSQGVLGIRSCSREGLGLRSSALRVRDGQALTLTHRSRNTEGYLRLLEAVGEANPTGDLYLISPTIFRAIRVRPSAVGLLPALRRFSRWPPSSGVVSRLRFSVTAFIQVIPMLPQRTIYGSPCTLGGVFIPSPSAKSRSLMK